MRGMLSRQEMERVIQQGGAVLYRGRSIARVQDLPSEAELAQGDPQAELQAAANLQTQMAELQRQLAQLQPAAPSGEGGDETGDETGDQADVETTTERTRRRAKNGGEG